MKKISLEGRKRIGELGTVEAIAEKKAQLMALQQEHHAVAQPVIASKPVAPELIAPATPSKPQKPAAVIERQVELPLVQPPPRRELTVEFVVEQLTTVYNKLSRLGSRSVRHYTPQMLSDHLVKELREVLKQKAKEGAAARLSDRNNMLACQAFIDEVRLQLAQKGIRLNALKVVPTN